MKHREKSVKFWLQALLLWGIVDSYAIFNWMGMRFWLPTFLVLLVPFLLLNLKLPSARCPSVRLALLDSGAQLLRLFLAVTGGTVLFCALWICRARVGWGAVAVQTVIAILLLALLFWNGMIRVYLTSVQLGIRWRVIGALCGPIPLLHLWALSHILQVTGQESAAEHRRIELDRTEAAATDCATRYPVLLVHGVFFRDVALLNYWGRVPTTLKRHGAVIRYGRQQSASSVAESGRELAQRIADIVAETGCKKVNLIAHSKGGLDCRYAITHAGAAEMVASLTTVNTPHRGCRFAEVLLQRIPRPIQWFIARRYNRIARLAGDQKPDFMAAVQDLTASACARFNEQTPDADGVFYQSVGSVMQRAGDGRFPLNLTYPLVRHYDGENDGLVAVSSMRWGNHFRFVRTEGRGVSHGDMVDLNRENIPGFDVREFYLDLVRELKEKGF